MAANPGRNPFEGADEQPLVDLRYRCGVVARCVRPDQRRWKPWPGGVVCAWDILSWQPAVGKEYELVWPRQS